MKCRVCGKKIKTFDIVKDNIEEVTSFYFKPTFSEKVNIELYKCDECDHFQIKNMLDEDYYDKYNIVYNPDQKEETSGYPKALLKFYENIISKCIKKCRYKKYFLDVGCGSGEILKIAEKYFKQSLGVEPSKNCCQLASKNGVNVLNSNFDESTKFENKFDCIVSFMVLEHIEDVNGFVRAIYNNLDEGGIAIINVPNGKKIVNEAMYGDIFREHLNYFTPKSMVYLFEKNNFEIVKIEECYTDELYLTVLVRKRKESVLLSEKKNRDIEQLNNMLIDFEKIAFFGIGIRARNILNLISHKEKIIYLFDNNKDIEKKYLINCDIPISCPKLEEINMCDLILITSFEYYDEIIKELIQIYKYKGKIIYIKDNEYCIWEDLGKEK